MRLISSSILPILERIGWRAIPRGCTGRERGKTTGHHAICRSKHGRRGRIGRQPAHRPPATSHSKLSQHPFVSCSRSVALKPTWDVCTPQIRHPLPPAKPALYLSKPGKLQQPRHSQPGPEPSHCPAIPFQTPARTQQPAPSSALQHEPPADAPGLCLRTLCKRLPPAAAVHCGPCCSTACGAAEKARQAPPGLHTHQQAPSRRPACPTLQASRASAKGSLRLTPDRGGCAGRGLSRRQAPLSTRGYQLAKMTPQCSLLVVGWSLSARRITSVAAV